ncbi:MAG: glucose-1-phosphate adenylyltransferase subunit GlgD [Clostridia bacterium]|nr:glucose-1-phosphate adenylyltransferase subunit GlgD [Clostridia bacterium]
MRDTMGIIVTNDEKIPPITDKRAVIALPIAGSYRIIDFMLSNMANAGITNIGVVTESNYSSLMDHIKSGSPWDLDRKNQGLNIIPPNLAEFDYGKRRGDLDMLANAKAFLRKSNQTYVILSLGNTVYNINFNDVIEKHIENQSDITVVYKDMKGAEDEELSRYTLIELDEDNRITDIESKPQYPKSHNASLELYVMEKALLESIIDECSSRGDHDFIKDAISKKLHGLIITGYEFKGYYGKIDSLKAYFNNNMIFLDEDTRTELFNPENPIYTKNKDMPPASYKENSIVENSFISNGCIIEGTVRNSILSRGVIVKKGAVVKNCIIMQDSVIGEKVSLDYIVLDKETVISDGKKLIGQESYPVAVGKNTIV